DLRLDRGGGPGRGGLPAAGEGHQVGEQLGGGVVGDQKGVAHQLRERLGVNLGRRRALGGGGPGGLAGDRAPRLLEQRGEALGGVAGRGGGLGAVLLAVVPSLLQRERGGGGHPAAGPAVVPPGRVHPADEERVVQRHRDLGGALLRGELGRLLGQVP